MEICNEFVTHGGRCKNGNQWRYIHPRVCGSAKRRLKARKLQVSSSTINKDGALIYSAWDTDLPLDHPKRDYILQGVAEGFHITDP